MLILEPLQRARCALPGLGMQVPVHPSVPVLPLIPKAGQQMACLNGSAESEAVLIHSLSPFCFSRGYFQ